MTVDFFAYSSKPMRKKSRGESDNPLCPLQKLPSCEGRGRDLNPGARLHRPIGYQATSPRPLSILVTSETCYCLFMFSNLLIVTETVIDELVYKSR